MTAVGNWWDQLADPTARTIVGNLYAGRYSPADAGAVATQLTQGTFESRLPGATPGAGATFLSGPAYKSLLPYIGSHDFVGADPVPAYVGGEAFDPNASYLESGQSDAAYLVDHGFPTGSTPQGSFTPLDALELFGPVLAGPIFAAAGPAFGAGAAAGEGAAAAASGSSAAVDTIDISTSDLGGFGGFSSGGADLPAAFDFSAPGAALPDVPSSVTGPQVSTAPAPAPGTGLSNFFGSPAFSAVRSFATPLLTQALAPPPPPAPRSIYLGPGASPLPFADLAGYQSQAQRAQLSTAAPNLNGVDPASLPKSSNLPLLAGLGLVLLVFVKRRA